MKTKKLTQEEKKEILISKINSFNEKCSKGNLINRKHDWEATYAILGFARKDNRPMIMCSRCSKIYLY